MKKILFLLLFVFFFTFVVHANSLEIGQKFPLEKLTKESIQTDNTIIAFVPSLTEDCEYAGMLTQSFYYYFDRQLAFEKLPKSPTTKVFFIVADQPDATRSMQNIIGKMNVIYDKKGKYFNTFGIPQPSSKNAESTIVLLDSDYNISLIDKNYRAQGEHLKPLENKIKEQNKIDLKITSSNNQKELKIGDTAPDFQINETQKLSDFRGKIVLISFYPAAFSGILPKQKVVPLSSLTNLSEKDLMSCSYQIGKLDVKSFAIKELEMRIVISSSTQSILFNWQNVLNTQNIIYANDSDYSTSLKYGSYNPNGYNNRVSVIIDRRGKIAYIDKSFETNDEKALNTKLDELLQTK